MHIWRTSLFEMCTSMMLSRSCWADKNSMLSRGLFWRNSLTPEDWLHSITPSLEQVGADCPEKYIPGSFNYFLELCKIQERRNVHAHVQSWSCTCTVVKILESTYLDMYSQSEPKLEGFQTCFNSTCMLIEILKYLCQLGKHVYNLHRFPTREN